MLLGTVPSIPLIISTTFTLMFYNFLQLSGNVMVVLIIDGVLGTGNVKVMLINNGVLGTVHKIIAA